MRQERTTRVGVILLAAFPLITGVLAMVAPRVFFEQIGRYGAENLHYVGDVGAFVAAFGLLLGLSAWRPAWRVPLLTLGAAWYALHAFNHVIDTDEARTQARGIADTAALALGAALTPAWRGCRHARREGVPGLGERRDRAPAGA